MNHYPRHIPDWRTATYNLTHQQRGVYSDLIDTYYDREEPLSSDFERLAKDHGCLGDALRADLRYILDRYFKLDGAVLRHERCDEEIAAFHHKSDVARAASKKGVSARAERKRRRTQPNDQSNGDRPVDPMVDQPLTGSGPDHHLPNTQYPLRTPNGVQGGEEGSASPTPPPPPPPPAPTPAPAAEQKRKPSKKCPKDFVVTPEMVVWAGENVPLLGPKDIDAETATFKDHTFGNAITDWVGAWRNWLRKEQKFREQRGGGRALVARAPTRADKGAAFAQAVMGNGNGEHHGASGSKGFVIDAESRVVRDGEEHPPEPPAG